MRYFFLLLLIFLLGCTSSRVMHPPSAPAQKGSTSPAVSHYLSGALHDFEEKYKEALAEYHQALLYDSTSAQILKAIGRDLYRIGNFYSALSYFNRSLKYAPNDVETLYFSGEAALKTKDYAEAIKYFEAMFSLAPYNGVAQNRLIVLYTQTGAVEKLISLREKMVELYGYEDTSAYQLLTLYMQFRHLDRAEELVKKLIDADPEKAYHYYLLGNVSELRKDTLQAITAYEKAISLDRRESKSLNQLYLLYLDRHDWPRMIRTFSDVVKQDSANGRARLFLAEGYFYNDQPELAKQTLKPLLNDRDFQAQAHQLMGRIAATERSFAEARRHFREFTRLEPWNARGWEFLAVLYYQDQKYDSCAAVLEEAFVKTTKDAGLLSLYGNALNQMGRLEEAVPPLEEAAQINPGDLNTIVTLAIVYDNLKRFSELDSLYETALNRFPGNALLLNNYSYSLSERAVRLQEALAMAEKAVAQEPQNGAFLDTIGWIYFQLGDTAKALEYIKKAVSLREDSPEVLEHLGDIYQKMGDIEQARVFWRKALDGDPGNEELLKKLNQ